MVETRDQTWGLNKLRTVDWHQDAIDQDEIIEAIRNSGQGELEMLRDYVAFLLESNVRLWGILNAMSLVLLDSDLKGNQK